MKRCSIVSAIPELLCYTYVMRRLNFFITNYLILLTLILCSAPLPAQQTHSGDRVYQLGVQNFDYFPHYNFTDEEKHSFLEQVVALIQLRTDIAIKVVPLPTKRLEYAFFESQELDFIYPANPRWYQNKHQDLVFSDVVVTSVAGTMVRDTGTPANKIKAISIPFGFTPVKWYQDPRTQQVQIFGVPTADMALQMVANDRTQAADVELNVAQHLNMLNGYALVLDPELPLSFPEFRFASLKHPQLIEQLNEFLQENKEDIAAIKRQLLIKESLE